MNIIQSAQFLFESASWRVIGTPYRLKNHHESNYSAVRMACLVLKSEGLPIAAFWEDVDGAFNASLHYEGKSIFYTPSSDLQDQIEHVNKNLPEGVPPIDCEVCLR